MTFPRGPLKLDDCQAHGPGSGAEIELVRPPWGEVLAAGAAAPQFAFSEPELQELADSLRARGGVVARRYRGLAAIEPGVLAATCVAPASRRTSPISAAEAASLIGILNAPPMEARRASEERGRWSE